MQLPIYPLYATNNDTRYDFVSTGPKGLITKQVRFALLHGDDVYNLAFGDFDPTTQVFNDQVVSNNGDLELLLAPVAAAVHDFCRQRPGASIFAVGSTPARTRLYRMAIAHYLDRLQAQFTIYDELGSEWEPFHPHRFYTAFFAQSNDFFNDYL